MGKLSFSNYSLIIFTLFNPERLEKLDQEPKSQIVCLQDVSDSMETKDVITSEGDPIKRSTWTRQFLKGEWIKNLEDNATVLVKNFSSYSGANATDISSAIRNTIDQTNSLKAILLLTDGDANTGRRSSLLEEELVHYLFQFTALSLDRTRHFLT